MPKIRSNMGWGGTGAEEIGDLLRAVADDLATLKAAVVELQGLTPGATAATDLTLEK